MSQSQAQQPQQPMKAAVNKRVGALRISAPAASDGPRRSSYVPPSPVPWPNVSADFLVNLVEPPRTVTLVVRPRMRDTLLELAPLVGLKPEDVDNDRIRVKRTRRPGSAAPTPGGQGQNITGNYAWDTTVRKFWDSRTSREEAAAIQRLQELKKIIEAGLVEAKDSPGGVSSVTDAVLELWEWSTRAQFRPLFLSQHVVQTLAKVLAEKHLVAAGTPTVAILCVYALDERQAMLLDQLKVVDSLYLRVAEQHAAREVTLREHAAKQRSRQQRRGSRAEKSDSAQRVMPVRGMGEDIVIHIDYCAASFMAGLLSHASGRAVVYNAGVAGVKLLELLVGSRELATAALAADALCCLACCASQSSWYPRNLFVAYHRDLGMVARSQLRAALEHVYEWMSPSTPASEHIHIELAAAAVATTMALTPAGITVMRAARMLPVLARVWTRVHDYLHTRLHGEGSTLLDDSVTQAARNTANAITVDPQAMARVNQVLRKTQASNGRGPLKLTTVARLSGLKSDAAKNERHHEQAERILEYLSSALWGCAVGGVQKPLTKHDAHWTQLNVVKLAVMMMDESDVKVARAGIGLLANACAWRDGGIKPASRGALMSRGTTAVSSPSNHMGGAEDSTTSVKFMDVTPSAKQKKKRLMLDAAAKASPKAGGLLASPSRSHVGSPSRKAGKGSKRGLGGSGSAVTPGLSSLNPSFRKSKGTLYARAEASALPKPVRYFLSEHGCRALMRRAKEELHDMRLCFVAINALSQLASTGGRVVQLELWRCGVSTFLIKSLGNVYQRMADNAMASSEQARQDVEDAAAMADMTVIEEGEDEDDDDHEPAEPPATAAKRGHKHGRRHRGGSTSHGSSRRDARRESRHGSRRMSKGAMGSSRESKAKLKGAKSAHKSSSRRLVSAGSHRNLPKSFRHFRTAMAERAKSAGGDLAARVGVALAMDTPSLMMLRQIASACMGLAVCYGARRPPEFVETVVCLLRHKDAVTLRYATLAVWALAHDRRNRRDVCDVGAMVLLVKWASLLLLTAMGNSKVLTQLEQQNVTLPLAPEAEAEAKAMAKNASMAASLLRSVKPSKNQVEQEESEAKAKAGAEEPSESEEDILLKAARLEMGRRQAAELLQVVMGCIWLMCCGVEENIHTFIEHHGMELVADVLKNCTASLQTLARMSGVVQVALGMVWTLADLPYVRGNVTSSYHEIPETVFKIVFDPDFDGRANMKDGLAAMAGNIPDGDDAVLGTENEVDPEVRVRAAGFLLDVLRDKDVRERLGAEGGDKTFMERLWTDMLGSQDAEPREYAIRTVARAAKSSKSKLKFLHEGGVAQLVGYLREFMGDPDMLQDSLMLALMHGLLNLSTEPEIQHYLGRECLNELMELAEDLDQPEIQAFASRIVLNLRRHPSNITRIYIKELKAKERQWKETHMEWKHAVPRPTVGPSPFNTFYRPEASTQFMEWFDGEITEAKSLPHGHPLDSIAFQAHNTSAWHERSFMSLPSLTVGSTSFTVPRKVRRPKAPTFQRTMCGSITSIWEDRDDDVHTVSLVALGHKSARASAPAATGAIARKRNSGLSAFQPDVEDVREQKELRGEVQPRRGRRRSLFEVATGKLEESTLSAVAPPMVDGVDATEDGEAGATSNKLVAAAAAAAAATSSQVPPGGLPAVESSSRFGKIGELAASISALKNTAVEQMLKNRASGYGGDEDGFHTGRTSDTDSPGGGGGGGRRHGGSKVARRISSIRVSAESTAIEADMKRVLTAAQKSTIGSNGPARMVATYLETVPRYWAPKVHSYAVAGANGEELDPSDPTVPVVVVMEPRTSRHRVKFMPKARSVAAKQAEEQWQRELQSLGADGLSAKERKKKLRAAKRKKRDKPWRVVKDAAPPMSPIVRQGSTATLPPPTKDGGAGGVVSRQRRNSADSLSLPPATPFKPSVRLARFEHVPGCKVCEGMYKHYTLPDGRMMHYYHDDVLNELVLDHVVQPPAYPLGLREIGLIDGLPPPPPAVRPVEEDIPSRYVPHAPIGTPQPKSVSLPAPERLQFEVYEEVEEVKSVAPEPKKPEKPWSLYRSIFYPRLKESYARSFYDDGRAIEDAFEVDWGRCMSKHGLAKLIVKAGIKAQVDTISETALDVLKNTVHKYYEPICSLFDYYSVLGDGFNFAIRGNAFYAFLDSAQLPEREDQPDFNHYVASHQFDIMFKAVTFQDAATKKEGVNAQLMMMRFEWIDMLIRICIHKYLLNSKPAASVAEAFEKLFQINVLPTQPPEGLTDKDTFRRQRLYNKHVDAILKANKKPLQLTFKMLTKPMFDRKRRWVLDVDTWMLYLRRINVVDNDFIALSQLDAQLAFTWSKMGVRDELKDQLDWITLTFTDFLEALCRLADATAVPTDEDLRATRTENAFEYFTEIRPRLELRRPSAGNLLGEKQRDVAPKLARLLEYVIPMTARTYKRRDIDPRYG